MPKPADLIEVSFLGAKQQVELKKKLGDNVRVTMVGQIVEVGSRRTAEHGRTKFAKVQIDNIEVE